jgi:hypothetical protein
VRSAKRGVRRASVSQSGLDLGLEQAVNFFAGRRSCGWRSGSLALMTKLCPQAGEVASFWRPEFAGFPILSFGWFALSIR